MAMTASVLDEGLNLPSKESRGRSTTLRANAFGVDDDEDDDDDPGMETSGKGRVKSSRDKCRDVA